MILPKRQDTICLLQAVKFRMIVTQDKLRSLYGLRGRTITVQTVLLNTAKDDKGPQIDVLNTAKNDKGP